MAVEALTGVAPPPVARYSARWMRRIMGWLLALIGLVALAAGGWYAFIRSVETPDYAVVVADGAYEVRDYPRLLAAEVRRAGSREAAVQRGFGPLAGYIFAKSRPGPKISMTAPVTQAPDHDDEWRVRFVMPAKYTKESLPKPGSDDVRIVEIPAQRVAAVRFSGRATDALFEAHAEDLRRWLEGQGYTATSTPTFAYYDDPSIPGPLRRNEVLIPVGDGP